MFDRIKDTFFQILKSRFLVLVIAFTALSAVMIGRVFYLQIVKGEYYLNNYKLQIRKTREIAGTRGNIYDRNGNLLAYNELAYSITIEDNISADTVKEKNAIMNEILASVISIVEAHGNSVISDFGIILDANGDYQFAQSSDTQKLRFIADVYGLKTIDELSEKQKNYSAADIIQYLCEDEVYGYGLEQKDADKAYILKMINLRYAISLNRYQKFIPTTIASDVSAETVAAIMENLDSLEGVNVSEDYLRRYTDSKYFASIIGYTGKISQDEYDSLDTDIKEKYSLTDIIGKAGLEQTMDSTLQGEKGEQILYVDSVGKVIDMVSNKDSKAGSDVYLTIDKDLQEITYQLIEEKLAGILLAKLNNTMDYDPSTASDSSQIIIPIGDVYNTFFANNILNIEHFTAQDAGQAEQAIQNTFTERQTSAIAEVMAYLQDPNSAAYKDLSPEMQSYINYIEADLLSNNAGIIMKDAIDSSDETYKAWKSDETISLNAYLNYAISKNWIDTSKLSNYVAEGKYSDSNEVYQGILSYLQDYLPTDTDFDKLLYKYLIKSSGISGNQVCAALYEQGIFPKDDETYNGLLTGSVDPYSLLYSKIESLELTPGELALEPCTGSAVVTDVNTGKVLACVSYPGYDNNRLANTMDSAYYNQLVKDLSSPLYNNATQEKTAPGSTYKMVSSVAGLTEGVIDTSSIISCSGIFDKVVPNPKCWIYPGAHGGLNVTGAIENSCNDFFYEVGYRLSTTEDGTYSSDLGTQKLAKYATEFGLAETSGLEIPESKPQISDSYSVPSAIGQGTNNYTVSQLNRYVTTVANGGTVYNLTLLDKTTDTDGQVIKEFEPTVYNQMDDVASTTWSAVQEGMVDMVDSSSVFSGNMGDFSMAGKTGTAQQSETHPDHILFVGYAPSASPEISLAVRIANGYSSNYTAEIGRDIVRFRYGITDKAELITGKAATLGAASHGD
ncbi:MAG: penicillin-binding transpeptidase domain-containing protein [Hespellia sp.]|nr:penicillin-binding transpeptidase domain-containing protein [Hespellia sp.]